MDLPMREVVAELLKPEFDVSLRGDLHGKRVLLRADFNVPVDDKGVVTDASRVTATLPAIRLLLAKGAKLVLASHFGRPEPRKQSWDDMRTSFSLAPVAALLQQELGAGSFRGLAEDCVGPRAEAAVDALEPGQAVLLENSRFHAGDTGNAPEFAAALARLCDVFVNDAFGVMHRDQGSVTGVVDLVPDSYPGPLVRHELEAMAGRLYDPVRPLGVVLGGAKVADKIGCVASLIEMADVLLIGGRMAFTWLAAQGVSVGSTQIEKEWLEPCRKMMARAKERGVQLVLPRDVLWSSRLDAPQDTGVQVLTKTCCTEDKPCIPAGRYGVDIGPGTCSDFVAALLRCRTVFWNGPMGKFEVPEFGAGTLAVARALDQASQQGAITIIGGGDSVAAVLAAGMGGHITHISTGGGASIELLEGKGMPGLRTLVRRRQEQRQDGQVGGQQQPQQQQNGC